MDVEEVYLCGDCGEDYEDIMEARTCCAPTPETAYVCGHCDKQHPAEDDALACCDQRTLCPACFRSHGINSLDSLAIKIGGHCRTCNPHFDYDTQAQIEELHFQSRGEWIALNK